MVRGSSRSTRAGDDRVVNTSSYVRDGSTDAAIGVVPSSCDLPRSISATVAPLGFESMRTSTSAAGAAAITGASAASPGATIGVVASRGALGEIAAGAALGTSRGLGEGPTGAWLRGETLPATRTKPPITTPARTISTSGNHSRSDRRRAFGARTNRSVLPDRSFVAGSTNTGAAGPGADHTCVVVGTGLDGVCQRRTGAGSRRGTGGGERVCVVTVAPPRGTTGGGGGRVERGAGAMTWIGVWTDDAITSTDESDASPASTGAWLAAAGGSNGGARRLGSNGAAIGIVAGCVVCASTAARRAAAWFRPARCVPSAGVLSGTGAATGLARDPGSGGITMVRSGAPAGRATVFWVGSPLVRTVSSVLVTSSLFATDPPTQ